MWKKLEERYKAFFGIDEIESDPMLQSLHYVLFIGFFISFSSWLRAHAITMALARRGGHVCLPYFQDCGRFYFLDTLPSSYGQVSFYALLTGLLCLSGICAMKKKWAWAHFFMIIPFFWKVLYIAVLTNLGSADFEYFHLPFVFVYLFCFRKTYFLRRVLVLLYLTAATMKFNESWVTGAYFTSLKLGMPWFSNAMVPWITNGVAFFEILTPWLLLSSRDKVRLTVLGLWVVFHVYSLTLVQYLYPSYCLPILLVLFISEVSAKDKNPSFKWRNFRGWVFMAWLFVIASIPHLMAGNNLYTLKGQKMGVSMFDANHQCISEVTTHNKDGSSQTDALQNQSPMNRCAPYEVFFGLHQMCQKGEVSSIGWKFDSSINGGPFYRIVDVQNVCDLEYRAFGENPWIRSPEEGAPVIGYPKKNEIQGLRDWKKVSSFENPQIFLSPLQQWLFEQQNLVIRFWWLLWCGTAIYFITRRFRKLRKAATR